jgi:hypothetical protein
VIQRVGYLAKEVGRARGARRCLEINFEINPDGVIRIDELFLNATEQMLNLRNKANTC